MTRIHQLILNNADGRTNVLLFQFRENLNANFASSRVLTTLAVALGLAAALPAMAASWEPTKTVEFIVPAGTGGGADQMARLIQGIVTKNKLMKSSIVVVNKGGGAGAEGFSRSRTARATDTRS